MRVFFGQLAAMVHAAEEFEREVHRYGFIHPEADPKELMRQAQELAIKTPLTALEAWREIIRRKDTTMTLTAIITGLPGKYGNYDAVLAIRAAMGVAADRARMFGHIGRADGLEGRPVGYVALSEYMSAEDELAYRVEWKKTKKHLIRLPAPWPDTFIMNAEGFEDAPQEVPSMVLAMAMRAFVADGFAVTGFVRSFPEQAYGYELSPVKQESGSIFWQLIYRETGSNNLLCTDPSLSGLLSRLAEDSEALWL